MGIIARMSGEEPGVFSKLLHALGGKGHYGEYLIDYALSNDNLEGRLATFTNLVLPHRGRTTEIDVLLLHEKGLFVLESKNYSGWIFGSVDQRQWTQSLKGGHKTHFGNPITQNKNHIAALSKALNLPREYFTSLIVFSERCELKKVPSSTPDCIICKREHMLREIRSILDERPVVFDGIAFDNAKQAIEKLQTDQVSSAEHVANVKKIQSGEICPYCGSPLVKRDGKYGEFLGCSSFPKCKFTRNLQEE